jgi:glycosyltransferase involved in cell wall biosynthesis
MPAYNVARYIRAAIESVQAQTFTDWELVVFDDCSTDGTPDVVETLLDDPRIRLERAAKNLGRGGAHNAALGLSRSDTIAICDSDDLQVPSRLESQLEFLTTHSEVDVVGGQILYFDDTHPPRRRFDYPTSHEAIRARLERGKMSIAHAACMMRRHVIERAGGYNPSFRVAQDFELFHRVRRSCRFAALAQDVMFYRESYPGADWKKYRESELWRRYAILLHSPGMPVVGFDAFRRAPVTRVRSQLFDRLRFGRVRVRTLLGKTDSLK